MYKFLFIQTKHQYHPYRNWIYLGYNKTYLEPCQNCKMESLAEIVIALVVKYFRKAVNLRCLTGL